MRPLSAYHYQVKHLLERYGRAWRYARGRMTKTDANALAYECQYIAGVYPLETITVEGALATACEEYVETSELRELIEEACDRVADKWSSDGNAAGVAESWALDLVAEYAADRNIVLVERDAAEQEG